MVLMDFKSINGSDTAETSEHKYVLICLAAQNDFSLAALVAYIMSILL